MSFSKSVYALLLACGLLASSCASSSPNGHDDHRGDRDHRGDHRPNRR